MSYLGKFCVLVVLSWFHIIKRVCFIRSLKMISTTRHTRMWEWNTYHPSHNDEPTELQVESAHLVAMRFWLSYGLWIVNFWLFHKLIKKIWWNEDQRPWKKKTQKWHRSSYPLQYQFKTVVVIMLGFSYGWKEKKSVRSVGSFFSLKIGVYMKDNYNIEN